MHKVKGCLNQECSDYKKKVKYKEKDSFCKSCGRRLSYVCKKCYTQIPQESIGRLCVRCEAGRQDLKDKVIKWGKSAGAAAAGIVAIIFYNGKKK